MSWRNFIIFSLLLPSYVWANVSLFSIRPDWEQLTLYLADEKLLEAVVKDEKLVKNFSERLDNANTQNTAERLAKVEELLNSPEGKKIVEEVKKNKDVIIKEKFEEVTGAKCGRTTCTVSPFKMQMGDRILTADTFEVPHKNGVPDLRQGVGTNTVLVDPKFGPINLGTSSIDIQNNNSAIDLGISSSDFSYVQQDKSQLSIPGGVSLNTRISDNSEEDNVYHLDLKAKSGFQYNKADAKELVSLSSTGPSSLSLSQDRTTGATRLLFRTDYPDNKITYAQQQGDSRLVVSTRGETYLLAEDGNYLLTSQELGVEKDASRGEVKGLELRKDGELVQGRSSEGKFANGSDQVNLRNFDFAFNDQSKDGNFRIGELSGRTGNTIFRGSNAQLGLAQNIRTISFQDIAVQDPENKITAVNTFLEFEEKDKIYSGKTRSQEVLYQNGKEQIRIRGMEAIFNIGDSKDINGSLSDLNYKSSSLIVNLEAIDPEGKKERFKLKILEKDGERIYQVYSENGKLIKIDAATDKHLLAAVTDSITYFESPQGSELIVKNFKGELKETKTNSRANFALAHGQYFQTAGKEIFLAQTGDIQYEGSHLKFGELHYIKDEGTEFYRVSNSDLFYTKKNDQLSGKNVSGQMQRSGDSQVGNVNFQELGFRNQSSEVKVSGAEISYRANKNERVILGGANNLSGTIEGYKVDVFIKDNANQDKKVQVHVFEGENGSHYKLYNDSGAEITINGAKDRERYQAVFKNIEYIASPEFKYFLTDNLSASVDHKGVSGNIHTQKIEFYDSPLVRSGRVDGLEFKLSDKDIRGEGSFSQVFYNQTDKKDEGGIYKGQISLVDQKLQADVNFESALYQKLKEPGNDLTLIRFDNTQLVAVEEGAFRTSMNIDNASYLQSRNMTVIELNSIRDLKLDELKNKISASGNINRLVQIQTKDQNGKKVNYYLLEGADIDITSKEHSIVGQISAKYLEVTQSGNTTVFSGEARGSARYQGPVDVVVDGSFKGRDLTYYSESHSTPKVISQYFAIESVTPEGGLDKLELNAGPDFWKNMISLEAKGNAGKKLDFSFIQDKEQGTYYLKAEFKEGDKVKVKLFPFTLESKKEGDTAKIELLLTPKGQNYLNHLDIITNIVSATEITNFLEISSGGMIIAKTPDLKGFGIEIMYQDETVFNPGITPPNGSSKAATYGAGIYYKSESGAQSSIGVMLSGDSEYQYQTNGRGVLKVMGMSMPQSGSIPGTVNLYFKHKTAKGDSAYVGLFADTTSYTVDRNHLSRNASYYSGGREMGGVGVTAGITKKLSDTSSITIAGGLTNNFQDPALCITYEMQIGKGSISTLARDMREINDFHQQPINPFGGRSVAVVRGPTVEAAKDLYFDRLNFLDWEIAKIESAQKILGKLEQLIDKYDADTVRKIRHWENRNLLSKYEETMVKNIADQINERNHKTMTPSLVDWKNKITNRVKLKELASYQEEAEQVRKRGW